MSSVQTPRAVGWWLLGCTALVLTMVVLGGATRLTGSGLSMTDWRPVTGLLPPLGDAAWAVEFARYQASPQFRLVNSWMDVEAFKGIFWLEYLHRLLGRAIGIVFLLPLLWFAWRGQVRGRLAGGLAALFCLGGLQGLLGWYMVQSGLVNDPQVSQYRLAAHLSLAVALYLIMLWLALRLVGAGTPAQGASPGLRRLAAGTGALALLTVFSGALVAGLEAGHIYNTFPLMGDDLLPPGLLAIDPVWRNAFENPATAQFVHRVLATLTLCAVLCTWAAGVRRVPAGRARRWLHACAVLALAQYALGVATLLAAVPVHLGVMHQGNALLLLGALLGFNEALRPRRERATSPPHQSTGVGAPALPETNLGRDTPAGEHS